MKFKELLDYYGYTEYQLSKETRIPMTTVYTFKSKRDITLRNAFKVAHALGISLETLHNKLYY